MEKYEIQKLRDLPIEGVAERLGIQIGRYHKALCPFHADKHPSLTFNVRKNNCRCYVCMNESMGTIDLAMKLLNKSFRDACQWLADAPYNPPVGDSYSGQDKFSNSQILENKNSFDANKFSKFFEHPWLSPEAQHFLFDERHLDPRVVRWCRLNSYTDKHGIPWLQIPYYDQEGKLIGVQSRNLHYEKGESKNEKGKMEVTEDSIPNSSLLIPNSALPRFRFPTGSHCTIYNLPVLKMLRPGEDLYIAEGCSDCWSLLSAGHKAIAIPSATLLNPNELLREINTLPMRDFCPRCSGDRGGAEGKGRVCMFPDQDAPGERLFLQLRDVLSKSGLTLVRHQLPPGCKDFSDYYCKQRQGSQELANLRIYFA